MANGYLSGEATSADTAPTDSREPTEYSSAPSSNDAGSVALEAVLVLGLLGDALAVDQRVSVVQPSD